MDTAELLEITGLVLAAGLIEEVRMDIVPVALRTGTPYYGAGPGAPTGGGPRGDASEQPSTPLRYQAHRWPISERT